MLSWASRGARWKWTPLSLTLLAGRVGQTKLQVDSSTYILSVDIASTRRMYSSTLWICNSISYVRKCYPSYLMHVSHRSRYQFHPQICVFHCMIRLETLLLRTNILIIYIWLDWLQKYCRVTITGPPFKIVALTYWIRATRSITLPSLIFLYSLLRKCKHVWTQNTWDSRGMLLAP